MTTSGRLLLHRRGNGPVDGADAGGVTGAFRASVEFRDEKINNSRHSLFIFNAPALVLRPPLCSSLTRLGVDVGGDLRRLKGK